MSNESSGTPMNTGADATASNKRKADELSTSDGKSDSATVAAKRPKLRSEQPRAREIAMLISYQGAGYSGLQHFPETPQIRTIEGELLDGLLKVGAIDESGHKDLRTIFWHRCSRYPTCALSNAEICRAQN